MTAHSDIQLELPTPIDEAAARHIALGPQLAADWTRQGRPVLHGSCVAFGGQAVSFIGPNGRGKSTMAAQLHLRGHRFVSDGLTLLESDEEGLRAHPGPGWFKLDDDSLRAVGRDPEEFEFVHAGVKKRLWELPSENERSASPLSHVYLLDDADELAVERLAGKNALQVVLENMYLLLFLRGKVAPVLFHQAALVARSVPVYRLRRPRGFQHATAVIDFIERDVAVRLANRGR